jgi:hypothetical protein
MATRESVIHSVQQQKSLKYESGDVAADVLNGIGAIAYLLESLSDIGNDALDGMTAYGLSIALRHYAACADRYLTVKAPKAGC